jgi:hypothetical protein
MSEPDVEQVIVVPRSDPVFSVFVWRSDSVTLARLRPVLEELRNLQDEPCTIGDGTPYGCWDTTCFPCAVRSVKAALFTTVEREQP